MKKVSLKNILSEKKIALATAIVTFFFVFVGLFAVDGIEKVISITGKNNIFANDIISTTINNYYTDDKSVAEELRNAQNAFLVGEYSYAIEIYQKYKNENAVAALNLGYMYSTGTGCVSDFDEACKYYIKSYELGLDSGLENLMALNFLHPQSVDKTLEMFKYGIENKSPTAQKYSAFLMTEKVYSNINDIVSQKSKEFENLSITKQKQLLSNQVTEANHTTEFFKNDTIPSNTEFRQYKLIYQDLQKYTAGTVTKLENDNGKWIEVNVPVYDFAEYNLYLVGNYTYKYADIIFSENFYEV